MYMHACMYMCTCTECKGSVCVYTVMVNIYLYFWYPEEATVEQRVCKEACDVQS